MTATLKGYTITPLSNGREKITAKYDNGGEIVTQEVIITPENPKVGKLNIAAKGPPSRYGRRDYNFIRAINALEWHNDGAGRAQDIYRTYDSEEPFCAASIQATAKTSNEWTLTLKNPDDDALTGAKIVNHVDRFFADIVTVCRLDNDADGTIGIKNMTAEAGVCALITFSLVAGDSSRDFAVHDGTSTLVYDISPGTGLLTCSDKECRTVDPGDLTYTGANGPTFALAYEQMIRNALIDDGYTFGEDFYVDAEYDSGNLRVRWFNKENPTTLLYPRNGGATLTQEGITRGGGPITPSSDNTGVHYKDLGLFASQVYSWPCEADTPCGTLTNAQTTLITGAGSTWGANVIATAAITGAEDTDTCESIRLSINSDTPVVSYIWSTGEETPEIYVNAKGAIWCDLVLASGCEVRAQTHITAF